MQTNAVARTTPQHLYSIPLNSVRFVARYSAKSVMSLWDKLAELEHTTPHELALRVGIGPSTVTGWRKGRAATVHPSLFGLIELKLGYRCTLRANGTWAIDKIDAPLPVARETQATYRPSDLSNALRGVAPTEIPAVITILNAIAGMGPERLNRLAAEVRQATPDKLAKILAVTLVLLQEEERMVDSIATLMHGATLPKGDPLEAHR